MLGTLHLERGAVDTISSDERLERSHKQPRCAGPNVRAAGRLSCLGAVAVATALHAYHCGRTADICASGQSAGGQLRVFHEQPQQPSDSSRCAFDEHPSLGRLLRE